MANIDRNLQVKIQHDGDLLDCYNTKIFNCFFYQRIYNYQGKLYIQIWYKNDVILFQEIYNFNNKGVTI